MSKHVKNKNWDSHPIISVKSKQNKSAGKRVGFSDLDHPNSVVHTLFKDQTFKIDEKDELQSPSFSFRKNQTKNNSANNWLIL